MCGIAGLINVEYENKLEILKNLELRGRDGFGYFAWSPTNQGMQKSLLPVSEYLTTKLEENKIALKSSVVLANTRAIPTTEFQSGAGSDLRNQQPFSRRRYAVVFNGLIANDKELIKKFSLNPDALVDTAILLPLFERVGIVDGLKMLDGSFAVVVFDKVDQKLYFGKNFMPLFYVIDSGSVIVVSLKEMLPDNLRSLAREVPAYSCITYDMKTGKELAPISLYRKERNKKVMVICSSGTDSVTTAYVYKHLGYEVTLAHFIYGQAAELVEKFAVEKIATDLNAKLIVYDAKPLFATFKDVSRLLNQKEADLNKQMLDAESTFSYVPNRNAIFVMIVAALAEKEGCDTVAFGGQQMDSVYPDNTPDFVRTIDGALKYSLNWQTNIKFAAPLIHLIKHEIVKLGLALNVPFRWVCSCYYPKLENGEVVVCGKCGCCQFRFSSFKMLGVVDTQKFEYLPSPNWFKDCKVQLEWSNADRDEFIRKYVERLT